MRAGRAAFNAGRFLGFLGAMAFASFLTVMCVAALVQVLSK